MTRPRRSLLPMMLRGSMRARRGRLALAAFAIAIGTSVAAALLLVSIDVGRKVATELRAYGPNLVLLPAAGESRGATTGAARFGPSVTAWLAREATDRHAIASIAAVRYAIGRSEGRAIVVAGTDMQGYAAVFPRMFGGADPPPNADAWLGRAAAQRLGVANGAPLRVELQPGAPTLELTRVALFETGGPEDEQLFVPASTLDAALGSPGHFHIAYARADGDAAHVLAYAKDATARAPEGALPEGATLRPITRLTEADGKMLARIRMLLLLVSVVALVAAALCAASTLADLVLERTGEIALLRSLGANRRDLLALFLGEAAILGAIGGAVGLALGMLAAQAIGWGVFGASIAIAPIVPPITLALGVAVALVAAIAPVNDALAIEPARILRGE